MKILKFMNIFIIPIILTIVFNINNQILNTFGQFIPSVRLVASSEIIGVIDCMLSEVEYRPQELLLHQKYQEK